MPQGGPQPQPSQQPLGGQGNFSSGPMGMIERMIYNRLYQSNPAFRNLANEVGNMTPEQAFQAKGVDINQVGNINPNQVRQFLGF